MKDMPIGRLLEEIKSGHPYIQHGVNTETGTVWTHDQSSVVWIQEDGGEAAWFDHRVLADAIRERCEG